MVVEEKVEMTDNQLSTYLSKDIPIDKINEVYEKVKEVCEFTSKVKYTYQQIINRYLAIL